MRYRAVAILILVAPLAVHALADAERHPQKDSQDQTTQDQPKPGTPGCGITGAGMMHSGQRAVNEGVTMERMMARHQEMSDTMNKLIESMTAIENEKDPAALKSRIAEHRALLEQMCNQMHESMMQDMMHRIMAGKASPIPLRPPVWK